MVFSLIDRHIMVSMKLEMRIKYEIRGELAL